jgi:hypothetical protein
MKTKIFAFTLLIIFIVGCENQKEDLSPKEKINNETPQVLDEKIDFNLNSISRRKNYDIISKLYNEAIEKNIKLKQLNDEINKISETKNYSLSDYYKFSNTNNKYWSASNRSIDDIQDSTLKKSTRKAFKILELKYRGNMSEYEKTLNLINERTISLNDQLILIKLFITESMIKNYQLNEKPEINKIKNIVIEYDKLIKKTEEYTKTIK